MNELTHEQAKPTLITKRGTDRLLDFLSTNQEATLRYHASDMILVLETDAAYLVQLEVKLRASGWFVLTNTPTATIKTNALIHMTRIKDVVASATEAEIKHLPRMPTCMLN